MTSDLVREWARLGADEIAPVCATVQDPQTMTRDLDARVQRLQAYADRFYDRWIEGLD